MITASVVLYKTPNSQIKNIIRSYRPSENRKLFIIDNNEIDDNQVTGIYFNENIIYIRNKKNIGYGSAHNIGIKKAIKCKSKYHIVLNPDLEFNYEIIDELVNYANCNDDVSYMLPLVKYTNGDIQYICKLLPTPFDLIFRRFFPTVGILKKINDKYTLKNTGYNHIMNPPCLSGCFMFLRIETLKQNNILFDENFFMYCEDFDLIRRLHRVGKTVFYPYVEIEHNHERGSYKNIKLLIMHIISACKYFNKYGWFFDKERKEFNICFLNEERDSYKSK